jgi:hypothetical protein
MLSKLLDLRPALTLVIRDDPAADTGLISGILRGDALLGRLAHDAILPQLPGLS